MFHFAVALCPSIKKTYDINISNGKNHYRWIEYAITSSIMLTIISLSIGLKEFNSLLLIFVLNSTIMFMGYLVEELIDTNRGAAVKITAVGWVACIVIWSILFKTMVESTQQLRTIAHSQNKDTLTIPIQKKIEVLDDLTIFIYLVTITIFVFFISFAIVQAVQVSRNITKNTHSYEKAYIILSLISKTSLVGLMFWGLYGRSQQEEENQRAIESQT